MASPPFDVGVVKAIVALVFPPLADKLVGAPGAVPVITGPVPAMVKIGTVVSVVPLVRMPIMLMGPEEGTVNWTMPRLPAVIG